MEIDDDGKYTFDEFVKYGRVSPKNLARRQELRVKHIMSTNPFSLKETDTLRSLEMVMEFKNIRHVPIVDSKLHVKGIVTHRDFLGASVSTLAKIDDRERKKVNRQIKIANIMKKDPQCVSPNTTLIEAAKLMHQHKYGCLLVTEDEKLVGIVTADGFIKFFTEWDLFV